MASLKATSASSPAKSSSTYKHDAATRLSPRMRAAVGVLFEAFVYAHDLDVSTWDFATEIASLRRFKLSNSDLRWLVGRGFVEHGVEVTLAGDEQRSFQHPTRLMLCKRTCFVLSTSGATLVRRLSQGDALPAPSDDHLPSDPPALAIATPPSPQPPKWDRDRQELRLGAAVIKRFKIPSIHEESILAAFEELGWPPRIDDPLPPGDDSAPNWRLQEAIESLDRNQSQHLLRFMADASGRGVRWEFGTLGAT
jgi:hypothetical protein